MKNRYFLFSLLLLIGCTNNFKEINTNPNSPSTAQPSLLLRQVLYNFADNMSYEGFVAGDLLSQHRTALDFNAFDRHALKSPQLGGNPWPIFYKNLRDNETILTLSQQDPLLAVYQGPALILKAYMAAGLTDLFGDVPYFEAFNGANGIVRPAYDAQQKIYLDPKGILDNLDKGILAIKNYKGIIKLQGDVMYNGDLNAWIRFANSLKIKALVRISGKVLRADQLQQLYDEGNYIKTNTQNAVFNFTNSAPNSFRLSQLRAGDFNNFVLSKTMADILLGLNDNRIETLFRPYSKSTTGQFSGLINGIDPSKTKVSLEEFSLGGTVFREDSSTLDANFLTAWEIQFTLAEAAQKGYITANAQTLYENGLRLAFEYWNTSIPANYLTGTAAYNNPASSPLKQIITQKWIANTINGYEGWIEYNRTGFPDLKTISASLNNNIIPVRMPYPAEEEALNSENYKKAAAATDGNSINTRVWWNN